MVKSKEKIDWRIICMAIVCITVIEMYALSMGINGVLLTIVIGIIAGMAGYILPSPIKIK